MCVCVCVCVYIFTIAFAIMVYHSILNIVLCAIQQDLVYPFYIQKLTSAKPNLPLHPSLNSLPCGKHQSVLCVCESVSVFVHLYHILGSVSYGRAI